MNTEPNRHRAGTGEPDRVPRHRAGTGEPDRVPRRRAEAAEPERTPKRRAGWVFFVAARYLRSRRKERKLSTSLLSITGIAVGVMALNTVIGVMNGFQLGTIEDILELNSFHLQWDFAETRTAEPVPEGLSGALQTGPADPNSADERSAALPASEAFPAAEALPVGDLETARRFARLLEDNALVRSAQPYADTQALVQGNFSGLQGIQIRAVDPEFFRSDQHALAMYQVLQGTLPDGEPGTIYLGEELALYLGVREGGQISVVSISDPDLDLRDPQEIILTVAGVFRTGYYPYDRNWGLVSLDTLGRDFGVRTGIRVGIKIHDRFRDREAASAVAAAARGFPGAPVSWRTLNRAIFGALRVEKGMMLFLVSLIFLVVGVNIYQGLRRVIHDRIRDIGVFKALGASPRRIERIFILEGWLIGAIGAGAGTALGALIGLNVNEMLAFFGRIFGAREAFAMQYFYLTSIPVELVPVEVVLIGVFGLASAVLAAFGASRAVRHVSPVEVLREE